MTNLTLPIFSDPEAARAHLEAIRWPSGKPICPHCGVKGEVTLVKGKSHRPGLYQCNACREPFTVTVGTVMEKSHIPLNKWVLGFHLMASSKKGISAHQLHRTLGVSYKSAWFMAHRIREAMAPKQPNGSFGSKGGIVEVDETFIGKKEGVPKRAAHHHKMKVLTLVDRDTKQARSRVLPTLTLAEMRPILRKHLSRKARLATDEAKHYQVLGRQYAAHETVTHGKEEWKKGETHTNTVEGFFSVFKRGMIGTYQHCGEQHLQRYLHEFDFRYSNRETLGVNDAARAAKAMKGAAGKRLTYRAVSG